MENFNLEKYLHSGSKSAKDYILLIRNNLKPIIFISSIIVFLTLVYAFLATDIYQSTVTVKIIQQSQNVLEGSKGSSPPENYLDRFIANEIGVIVNYDTRVKIAKALIDSFDNAKNKNLFSIIRAEKETGTNDHKSVGAIAGILWNILSVEQNQGTDVVEISAQSYSPYEAALIANTCALEYQKINLEINREKLTAIRKFLEEQSQKKLAELQSAEDTLMKFQEKGGIVSMDIQTSGLLDQLAQLDAQKEATRIELMTSNEVMKQYKFFLKKQNPQLVDYLENETSQAYINALQKQLAELQVNRDLAVSIKSPNVDITSKVKEYDKRIEELKQKLSSAINSITADGFSGNPEQVRQLALKLIEEEIKNNTLSVRLEQLETVTNKYEGDLKRLPKTSTELSQFQRTRETTQQLYLLVNEKYQEAMINELAQSGNAFIIGSGRIPSEPAKPNRKLIILLGFIIGFLVSFSYVLIKDFFDDTVKTPEDIEKNDISFLSWVPQLNLSGKKTKNDKELVALYDQDSPVGEAFRAVKARIQHSRIDSEFPKVILVTSPAESEGKTFVAVNLAGIFAKSNKRTLILDCDLRRPRIHTLMGVDKKPGLANYLGNIAKLDNIIRKTANNNLFYITSGTIPSNPAEVIESKAMRNFLVEIRDFFDVIIIDSAPIVAVIDSEILAELVDGTVLVISADKTENRLMTDAVDLIKQNNVPFLGTVLNNFKYKSGYGYYFNYYYNYSRSSNQKGRKKHKIKS